MQINVSTQIERPVLHAPSPPDRAVLRVARLAGVSVPTAAVIAELAGIGAFARRAGR